MKVLDFMRIVSELGAEIVDEEFTYRQMRRFCKRFGAGIEMQVDREVFYLFVERCDTVFAGKFKQVEH